MKSRKLVLGLLIMLALVVSSFTYAYWANTVVLGTETADATITIGSGEDVTVVAVVGAQGGSTLVLVPSDFVVDPVTQSASIEISFTVTWQDDARLTGIASAAVSAAIGDIFVDAVANPFGLISVVPKVGNPTGITLGQEVTFSFIVTMGTPNNLTEYTAVATKPITFELTFTIDPA